MMVKAKISKIYFAVARVINGTPVRIYVAQQPIKKNVQQPAPTPAGS